MNYETENIEFKSQFTPEIYKEVIAFANTEHCTLNNVAKQIINFNPFFILFLPRRFLLYR